jgi:hypothetical protein
MFEWELFPNLVESEDVVGPNPQESWLSVHPVPLVCITFPVVCTNISIYGQFCYLRVWFCKFSIEKFEFAAELSLG